MHSMKALQNALSRASSHCWRGDWDHLSWSPLLGHLAPTQRGRRTGRQCIATSFSTRISKACGTVICQRVACCPGWVICSSTLLLRDRNESLSSSSLLH
ncbi:LOW QUALITY PROTEIN: hypothetical protein QTO34_016046 [Cnephaeus nilssonii]|uniref:Uncharacterized protein n=1 Tax=Cnephaeus nilssonii TaxID=3371016 RepID=A0AA40I581_CNENI|nr:LOW QUALITY PROTEIN: hypothetical protein QTO34_016046 [Eptesicus nilssonii]